MSCAREFGCPLKSKASRLRDWNLAITEISRNILDALEIKSISITRLKLSSATTLSRIRATTLKSKASRLRDWNQLQLSLRLRDRTWNQKHLDYEIETNLRRFDEFTPKNLKSKASRLRDWNEFINKRQETEPESDLKSKASRLRDWNILWSFFLCPLIFLKSKASRLRDWN